jgi:hypothetical protein
MEKLKNQRLKIFLESEKIKSKDFAIALDSTPQFASALINGSAPIGNKMVDKITSIYPKLNKLWLVYGEGEMIVGTSSKTIDDSEKISYAAWKHLEDEVMYLREMLRMAMGNMANFQNSPLLAGKILPLKQESTFAGDFGLSKVA